MHNRYKSQIILQVSFINNNSHTTVDLSDISSLILLIHMTSIKHNMSWTDNYKCSGNKTVANISIVPLLWNW